MYVLPRDSRKFRWSSPLSSSYVLIFLEVLVNLSKIFRSELINMFLTLQELWNKTCPWYKSMGACKLDCSLMFSCEKYYSTSRSCCLAVKQEMQNPSGRIFLCSSVMWFFNYAWEFEVTHFTDGGNCISTQNEQIHHSFLLINTGRWPYAFHS